jgi:hypothetical protein
MVVDETVPTVQHDKSPAQVKVIRGEQGASGADGVDGTDGIDGTDGQDGAPGASVTVTMVPDANWPPAADANPLHWYVRVP